MRLSFGSWVLGLCAARTLGLSSPQLCGRFVRADVGALGHSDLKQPGCPLSGGPAWMAAVARVPPRIGPHMHAPTLSRVRHCVDHVSIGAFRCAVLCLSILCLPRTRPRCPLSTASPLAMRDRTMPGTGAWGLDQTCSESWQHTRGYGSKALAGVVDSGRDWWTEARDWTSGLTEEKSWGCLPGPPREAPWTSQETRSPDGDSSAARSNTYLTPATA